MGTAQVTSNFLHDVPAGHIHLAASKYSLPRLVTSSLIFSEPTNFARIHWMLLLRALSNQLCLSILIGISTFALLRALALAARTGLMLLISTRKGTL